MAVNEVEDSRTVATFVFGRKSAKFSGPLAMGVGRDLQEAAADAVIRLKARRAGELADPKSLVSDLVERLKSMNVSVFSRVDGPPEDQGHDYVNYETHCVAVAFGTDGKVAADVQSSCMTDGKVDPSKLRDLLRSGARSATYPQLSLALIDWTEVAQEFSHLEEEHQAECVKDVVSQESGFFPAPLTVVERLAQSPIQGVVLEPAPFVAGKKIDQDVLDVLLRCEVEGNLIRLPAVRFDPKFYKKVNEVLEGLGGKWIGRKVQAHQFEDDPTAALDVAIGTGTFVRPQDFGYFPTPQELVERLLELAELEPGMKMLEPSAGRAAIAWPAAKILGLDRVTVVEMLPGNFKKLIEMGFTAANQCDFLSLTPTPIFDRVIMNPPFSGLADIAHIQHAARFLKPDGRLISVTSPSWTFNSARKAAEFRDFVEDCEAHVEEVAAGAFKAAGTEISTRIVVFEAENFPWNRREEDRVVERQRA